ncbi:SDR family oxidoreductase [Actinomadura atramentaria]|uniref:SDR family oxidoreductase n=1 Tax=Actinomadura atramentaria TaxID=1990 RepID=UPI00036A5821|nr:SDR family oxidoreductase [Actinomadura atramentaria]
MRVLVTGASGWIGSAVVPELIGAGHRVTALARSDASAAAVAAAGAEAVRGSLDDLDVLRDAAAAAEGVIHLAYKHDVAFEQGDPPAAAAADRRAVEVLGEALAGSGRPLVLASGTAGVAPGRVLTERDARDAAAVARAHEGPNGRLGTAVHALGLADRGVRPSVVRLPPTVHGAGDRGFVAVLVGAARASGVAGYLGDGGNRWPAVHRDDAARLFRLALEDAPAASVLHAVADEGVPLRAVAEAIGTRLGVPAASIAPEDAPGHFGFLAQLVGADIPASSALTRELLDWEPTGPTLLEDLAAGRYTA